ncbi:unnamed protein product, partial [Rotaria sordida]
RELQTAQNENFQLEKIT